MPLRRREPEEKILDVDASMQGTLTFRDPVNLRINGKFEGTLETKGNLTIGRTASVFANIIGENIVVAGKVKGDIVAKQRLELVSSAIVQGDIRVAKLIIADGAIFEGRCHMLEDIFNPDELARYLEVELASILEWANSGKVPAFKEGDQWRFDRKKIDEWIALGKIK